MRIWFVISMVLCVVSFSAGATEKCKDLEILISSAETSKVFESIELKNKDGEAVLFSEFASNKEVTVRVGLKPDALQKYKEYVILMGVDALVAPSDLSFKEVANTSWGSLPIISTVRTYNFTYKGQQGETARERWDFSKYITPEEDDKLWLWALKLKI